MLLVDYLKKYTLLSNLYGVINYDYLRLRFMTRYGAREVRSDIPAENITDVAQNIVDININFLRGALSSNFSPSTTWSESGNSTRQYNDKGNDVVEHNTTNTTSINDTSTTNATANVVTDQQQNNSKYAFNSATSSPTDISVIKNTSDTTSNGNDTHTGNTTSALTGSDTTTKTNQGDNKDNYSKSGFDLTDYELSYRTYISAYDFLINLFARDILITSFCLWED